MGERKDLDRKGIRSVIREMVYRQKDYSPNQVTERYFQTIKKYGINAAFFNGLTLEEGCDLLDREFGDSNRIK